MINPVSLRLLPKQAQSLKQMQRLMMSPQMQQAIHLLQLPILELSHYVETELMQNPVIESIDENASENTDSEGKEEEELSLEEKDLEILRQLEEESKENFFEKGISYKRTEEEVERKAFLENSICSESSLFGILMEQALESFDDPLEVTMAEMLIGNFDENGFFQGSLEEIALLHHWPLHHLESILLRIQQFEPWGVGARDIQESLLIQLRLKGKEKSLAYHIIEDFFQDLLHNRITSLQKKLGCTSKELEEALYREIAKLHLHPGGLVSHQFIQYVKPDLLIKQEGDCLVVKVSEEAIPSLRINSKYLRMLEEESLPQETRDFIHNKIQAAKWMFHTLYQRNETLEKIGHYLSKVQEDFFLKSEGKLIPHTMKQMAAELGLHESTVARAVANKYIDTPKGLFPLRSFFTSTFIDDKGREISSETIKELLLKMVEKEDKHHPLSDQALSQGMKQKGVLCARRTVAKYRALLGIASAQMRRKF